MITLDDVIKEMGLDDVVITPDEWRAIAERYAEVKSQDISSPHTPEHRDWLISCRDSAQKIVDDINSVILNGYEKRILNEL